MTENDAQQIIDRAEESMSVDDAQRVVNVAEEAILDARLEQSSKAAEDHPATNQSGRIEAENVKGSRGSTVRSIIGNVGKTIVDKSRNMEKNIVEKARNAEKRIVDEAQHIFSKAKHAMITDHARNSAMGKHEAHHVTGDANENMSDMDPSQIINR